MAGTLASGLSYSARQLIRVQDHTDGSDPLALN
jgi:hypothetical protein